MNGIVEVAAWWLVGLLLWAATVSPALLELRHPALFTGRHQVIDDFLLDRRAALRALGAAESVHVAQLAADTWIRPHHGSAARLTDDVLQNAGLRPAIQYAGHGDEPVETQAFVAAGNGITLAHRLNVIINPDRVVPVPLAGPAPRRRLQAAVMRNQRAPAVRAVLDALREVARRRDDKTTAPRR